MTRDEATAKLSALLRRLHGDQVLLETIAELYVFGSYARGALEVTDVDIDIELDATRLGQLVSLEDEADLKLYFARLNGGDPSVSLTPDFAHTFPAGSKEASLLYRRGMSLDESVMRLEAITRPVAPEAGLDFSLAALRGVEAEVAREPRKLLFALVATGSLEVNRSQHKGTGERQPALAVLRALRTKERVFWPLETVTLELVRGNGYAEQLERLLTEMDLIWYDLLWSED